MYITRLIIDDFGALQNRNVTLKEGFNLITGNNESGKSTLCAFIKYVFYGFTDSKERERMVNFHTMCASGAVEIDFGGELYLISRRDGEKGKSKVSVTRADGSTFDEWRESAQNPGEYFFGIPEKLYSRSIYVSQSGGAAPDEGTASAISNLLLSGDEAVNLKSANNRLEDFRKELQYKRGRGGLIHETEDRIAKLKEEYENAYDIKKKCESIASEIMDSEEHLNELKEELAHAENTLEKTKAVKLRGYLQEDERLKKESLRIENDISALVSRNTYRGFCPNDEYASSVAALEAEISLREQTCEGLKKRLIESENERNAKIPKEYRQFLALGRTKGIKDTHSIFERKIKRLSIFTAVFFVFTAVFSALILFNSMFIVPSLASLLAGIVFAYFGISTNKKRKAFLSSLSPDGLAFEEVCAACEEYEAARAGEASSISKVYNDELEVLLKKREELEAMVEKWGKSTSEDAKCAYAAFSEQKAELSKQLMSVQGALDVNAAHLSAYSELEKERAMSFTEEELNLTDRRSASPEMIHTLKYSISSLEDQLHSLRISLASSGFDSVDPGMTMYKLEEERKRYAELSETFEAVNLAISALGEAEKSVRETVSPYLSRTSGELFSSITDGRYSTLLFDPSLSMKYVSSEHSAPISKEYLSGGSADLAWLCLRLALHRKLSESHPLPLILDECLVYFDDIRLEKILSLLNSFVSDGTQLIVFSASTREKAFVKDEDILEL